MPQPTILYPVLVSAELELEYPDDRESLSGLADVHGETRRRCVEYVSNGGDWTRLSQFITTKRRSDPHGFGLSPRTIQDGAVTEVYGEMKAHYYGEPRGAFPRPAFGPSRFRVRFSPVGSSSRYAPIRPVGGGLWSFHVPGLGRRSFPMERDAMPSSVIQLATVFESGAGRWSVGFSQGERVSS